MKEARYLAGTRAEPRCAVVLRLGARGDEPDYVAALEYLRHGWVEPARLESLLADVVSRFTSETLAQDPAEFRRKFRGLRQLYQLDRSAHGAHTRPAAPEPELSGGHQARRDVGHTPVPLELFWHRAR